MSVFAYVLRQSLNETFETVRNDCFRRTRVLGEELHFYFIINFKNSLRTCIAFVVTLDTHSGCVLFWKVLSQFHGTVWMWISLWNDSSLSSLSALKRKGRAEDSPAVGFLGFSVVGFPAVCSRVVFFLQTE